jgi:thiol-disulfide isomerase/thioredoxin
MKRGVVVTLLAVFALAGCRQESPAPSASAKSNPPATTAAPTVAPQAEAPAEPWPEETKLQRGSVLPETPLLRLEDGAPFQLASLRGNAVLLNVWATWCTPCRAETPELEALSKQYAARGLEVVGVSVDEASTGDKSIRDFVTEERAGYRMLRQPAGELMQVINTPALPATLLLDRNGGVQWIRIGPIRRDDPRVVAAIDAVLR